VVWGALVFTMLWQYPDVSPVVLWSSLVYPVYYFGLSLLLYVRSNPTNRSRPAGARRGA